MTTIRQPLGPLLRQLRSDVRADMAGMSRLKGSVARGGASLDVLTLPGMWATILFRLSSTAHRAGLRPLSRLLYAFNVVLTGADLAPAATVGPGLTIAHPTGVAWGSLLVCGRDVVFSGLVRLAGAGTENGTRLGEPRIGDGVVFLDGAKVIGPVTVGDRAVIAASAVVLTDVPAEALMVGMPARHVKNRADRQARLDPLTAAHSDVADLADASTADPS